MESYSVVTYIREIYEMIGETRNEKDVYSPAGTYDGAEPGRLW
jgi:hypothetical protein